MPRPYTGPKLWLDRRRGTWTILDGKGTNLRTGFTADERDAAVIALHKYSEGKTFALPRPVAPRTYKTPPIKGVYVAGFAQYVKIGVSVNIEERMKSIQMPEEVTLFGVVDGWLSKETELHKRFKQYRLKGEWFRNEGELADWINGGCQ